MRRPRASYLIIGFDLLTVSFAVAGLSQVEECAPCLPQGINGHTQNGPYSITCGVWSPVRATPPTPTSEGYAATHPAPSRPSTACRRW